jgi:hypothetical protein
LPGSVPVICEFNRVAEFFITLLGPPDDGTHQLLLTDELATILVDNADLDA